MLLDNIAPCTPGPKQVGLSVVLKDTEKADIIKLGTLLPRYMYPLTVRSVGHL
jgi:hypothetical protein